MIEHYHFHEIGSTNDYIKELLEEHNQVIVTSDIQREGRGRNSKKWLGSQGENVYFSFGIKHNHPPSAIELSLYQAAGCLAVQDALNKTTEFNIFKLKYPNDVIVNTPSGFRKICGVLVEHSFSGSICQTSVIGIGINVNQMAFPDEIDDTATSLKAMGINTTPAKIIVELTEMISKYIHKSTDYLFNEWQKRLNVVGKEITLLGSKDKWKVVYMLPDGRLKISNQNDGNILIVGDGDSIRYNLSDDV